MNVLESGLSNGPNPERQERTPDTAPAIPYTPGECGTSREDPTGSLLGGPMSTSGGSPHPSPSPFKLELVIPGIPEGKGRPKFTTVAGFARAYTPIKTREYENLIRLAASEAMGDLPPLEEALTMVVCAYVMPPKAFSRKKREAALAGSIRPTTKPDVDNYAKAALDGCNAIVYRDDKFVTDLGTRKRYSPIPRLVISIRTGD